MIEVHTPQEEDKYYNEKNKYRVICKCGHTTHISTREYTICSWCGKKVYSKKADFKNKILDKITELKSEETFICKNCNEIVEEEHRAENSYEQFREYDLCEWCFKEMKEDMR